MAASFVVLGHSMLPIVPGGAIGVSVFFALSGYLITSILLRNGMMVPENIGKFIVRRIARIYPMYAFSIGTIVVFIAICQPEQTKPLLHNLPGLLTFTKTVTDWFGFGIGVLWTLSVEFWFYVTFPFLLWGAMATRRLTLCIVIGIGISLLSKAFDSSWLTLKYYDHFLLGSLAAVAVRYRTSPSFFANPNVFKGCIAAILLIAAIPFPGARNYIWFGESFCTAALTACAIVAGSMNPPKISLPSVAYLGRISYSIYLMHAVILDFHRYKFGAVNNLPLFIGIVVAISSLTYFLVERPIERVVHRIVKYRQPEHAPDLVISSSKFPEQNRFASDHP